jgi:hypothetical protein
MIFFQISEDLPNGSYEHNQQLSRRNTPGNILILQRGGLGAVHPACQQEVEGCIPGPEIMEGLGLSPS